MRSIIILACCLFVISGCEMSFTTASLSEPAISEQVDPKTMASINPAELFSPSSNTLNATIKLSNAPPDTIVTARFYFLGDEKKEIADQSSSTSGTGYLNFSLSPPASGWPIGTYQVDYYLGNELKESLTFHVDDRQQTKATQTDTSTEPEVEPVVREAATVVAGALTDQVISQSVDGAVNPPAAQPTGSGDTANAAVVTNDRKYKEFKDDQFGFSLKLPEDWNFRVIGQNSDYLFSGPDENEEGEILIIVQMIDTRKSPQSALKNEMKNQVNQFSQISGAKILKKDEIQAGGVAAPFFLATYPSENSKGEKKAWGHTQLGLQNGPIILLISYAAPRDIYQRNINIFQHMMDSLQLSTPAS